LKQNSAKPQRQSSDRCTTYFMIVPKITSNLLKESLNLEESKHPKQRSPRGSEFPQT